MVIAGLIGLVKKWPGCTSIKIYIKNNKLKKYWGGKFLPADFKEGGITDASDHRER
jgi:hypothetical protein